MAPFYRRELVIPDGGITAFISAVKRLLERARRERPARASLALFLTAPRRYGRGSWMPPSGLSINARRDLAATGRLAGAFEGSEETESRARLPFDL